MFDRDDLDVRRGPAQALRGAIECMPLETRTAMREALSVNSIIVGAYTDRDGGVCPMLAAHRNGGRTSFAAFARAWDRYTRAGDAARRATDRELRTLAAMLDASIVSDDVGEAADLGAVIAAHRASQSHGGRRGEREHKRPGREVRRRDSGERDRTSELHRRHGWAWLRPFRRLDDYEEALRELEQTRPGGPAGPHRSGRQA